MALATRQILLTSSLDALSAKIEDFAQDKANVAAATDFTFENECYLEGLTSRLWQAWCLFCRWSFVESCLGTVDSAGNAVPALPPATSEAHVSGAAIAAKGKPQLSYWGTTNTLLRAEPTWGDVNVLLRIIARLQPANAAKLQAGCSAAHRGAKALQFIRNGAAHDNKQTRVEIDNLRSSYQVFSISHATHALFWIEPGSNDFLVIHAIEELKAASVLAVS